MSLGRWLWVGMVLPIVGGSWAGTNAPLNPASSVSRQFTAYAPGPILPAALCGFAEHVKHEWLDRMAVADHWHDPIVLVFRETSTSNAPASALRLQIAQIGPVRKYEISGWVPPAPEEGALAATIVEALCLEIANRSQLPGPGGWTSAQIPRWLVYGFAGVIHGDPERLLTVAHRSATAARPPLVSAVLGLAELPADAVARELFLANAWLLTDSLLRLPNGGAKLHQFLTRLRTTEGAFAEVYQGDFADAVAMEKWWSLVLARQATSAIPQDWTARATAAQLTALLRLPDGQAFNDLYRHSDQAGLRDVVVKRVAELEQLRSCAHPLYWSALAAYIEAGRWLVDDNLSRYRRAVARGDQLRQAARRQAEAISVTLDWAEQKYTTGTQSNVWTGYFQIIEQLENLKREHHDPISDYLDRFEK